MSWNWSWMDLETKLNLLQEKYVPLTTELLSWPPNKVFYKRNLKAIVGEKHLGILKSVNNRENKAHC